MTPIEKIQCVVNQGNQSQSKYAASVLRQTESNPAVPTDAQLQLIDVMFNSIRRRQLTDVERDALEFLGRF